MDELGSTALEISAAFRSGRSSAEDIVAAHPGRIRAENPQLNAFRVGRYQAAIAEARGLDAEPGNRDGILATTVQDLALGRGVLAGDARLGLASGAPDKLRIGASTCSPLVGRRPDADRQSGVDRAAAALAALAAPVRLADQRTYLVPVRFSPLGLEPGGVSSDEHPDGNTRRRSAVGGTDARSPGLRGTVAGGAAALERELPWQRHAAPREAERRPS